MTDTQMLEALFEHGWRVGRHQESASHRWAVWDLKCLIRGLGPTPRRALEDAILKVRVDVAMPLCRPFPDRAVHVGTAQVGTAQADEIERIRKEISRVAAS